MRSTIRSGCAFLLLMTGMIFPVAAQGPTPGSSIRPWFPAEQSSGKRPIEVARFGSGNRFVLIVGSMSGNDPESVALLDSVCELSRQFPPPEPITLLLVRTPNPDGFAEHVHTNSRGVELDRNFPSRNFTLAPTRLTGPHPASEPETQYLVKVLQEFRPARVLHVRSGNGEKPLVLLNETWRGLSGGATLPQDIPQAPYYYAFKAGSLEEFADAELKTSVATVLLSKGTRKLQAAELLRLSVGNFPSQDATTNTVAKPATPPAETPAVPVNTPSIPQTIPVENQEKTTLRGEVELLPPPPVLAPTTKQASQSSPANTSRFQELPKPPGR